MNKKGVIILNYLLYVFVITIPFAVCLSVYRWSKNKSEGIYFVEDKDLKSFFAAKSLKTKQKTEQVNKDITILQDDIVSLNEASKRIDESITEVNNEIKVTEEKLLNAERQRTLQMYGFYSSSHTDDMLDSEVEKLLHKEKQVAELIYSDQCYYVNSQLKYNNSTKLGLEMQKKVGIYMVRTFIVNAEEYINKLNKNNLDKQIDKIRKLASKCNKDNTSLRLEISNNLVTKYIEKIEIMNEYIQRLERENVERKEQNKLIKEQRKQALEEERKAKLVVSEMEKNDKELEKFKRLLLENPNSPQLQSEVALLEKKNAELASDKIELEKKLNELGAGYIYVISNIGAFGEGVYKIGYTRRSEPLDRVKELSGASVPFKYDVHAFIYDKKASSLESAVHEKLNDYRVNKENLRKEFFKVELSKIKDILSNELNKHVEFLHPNLGVEYYESLKMSGGGTVNEC